MPLKFDGFLALAKWGMFASFLPIVVNAPLNVYTDQSIDFKGTWGYLTDELRIDLSARTEQGGHWLLGSVLALQAAGFMLNMAARQPHHHQEAHPPPPGTWSLGGRCAVQWEAACRVRAITNNRYKKLMWKLLGYLSYFVRFIGLGVLVMNLIGLYVGMCEVPSLHVIISASFKHLVEAKDGLALIKKRLRFYFDSEKLLSPKVMIRYLMRTGNDNFYPDNWIIGALALCIVIAVPLARACAHLPVDGADALTTATRSCAAARASSASLSRTTCSGSCWCSRARASRRCSPRACPRRCARAWTRAST